MSPRLKGISKTPLWLLVFVIQLFIMGGIVAMTMLVNGDTDQCPSSTTSNHPTSTVYTDKLYYLIGALGGLLLILTLTVHIAVSLRISSLAQMLLQDPQVIIRDPLCLRKLSQTPWYGVSEIDMLQLAVVQSYNSFALAQLREQRASTGNAEAEWEWRTAVSDDEDIAQGDLEQGFVRSRKHSLASLQSAQSHHGPGSNARQLIHRLFTPRGNHPSFPVVDPSRPSRGQDGSDDEASSQQFYSLPNSLDEKSSLLLSGRRSVTQQQQQQQPHTNYSVNGGVGGTTIPSSLEMKGTNAAAAAPSHSRGVSSGGEDDGTGALSSSVSIVPWDPCDDNNNNTWAVLQKGLKLQSSLFVQLLSSIRVGQSLSNVTLPVHILESRSLLEMLSDVCVNWQLLLPVATGQITKPEERLLQIFKWYISAFHLKPRGPKKPYNSILGEVFQCLFPLNFESKSAPESGRTSPNRWRQPAAALRSRLTGNNNNNNNSNNNGSAAGGTSPPNAPSPVPAAAGGSPNYCFDAPKRCNGDNSFVFLAEQVSHHPPVSAFYGAYDELILIHGCYCPKGKMVSLNCAGSVGEGSFTVSFPREQLSYRVTYPTAYVSGIVAGTPTLELGGTVQITDLGANAGSATIEFFRKGWLSGTADRFTCRVQASAKQTNPPIELQGTWYDKVYYKRSGSSGGGDREEDLFFDPMAHERRIGGSHRPNAVDVGGHPKQSRAIWSDVTVALRAGNADAATAAKLKVETTQRAERKQLAQDGKEHKQTFFRFNRRGGSLRDATEEELADEENWIFTGEEQLRQY